jgi:hypothetical protein
MITELSCFAGAIEKPSYGQAIPGRSFPGDRLVQQFFKIQCVIQRQLSGKEKRNVEISAGKDCSIP